MSDDTKPFNKTQAMIDGFRESAGKEMVYRMSPLFVGEIELVGTIIKDAKAKKHGRIKHIYFSARHAWWVFLDNLRSR